MAENNPYGLTEEERSQINAMAETAKRPNPSYTALALSGLPGGANMGSQLQAQESRTNAGQLNSLTNAMNARSARRDTSKQQTALQGARQAFETGQADTLNDRTLTATDLANKRAVKAKEIDDAHELELQRIKSVGKSTDAQKLAAAQDKQTRQQAFAAWRTNQPKPQAIPASASDKFQNSVEQSRALDKAIGGFKDDYASSLSIVGKAENWLARIAGKHASPEMRKQAEFWRDYGYDLVLEARHSKFGSAFTEAERAAWDAVNIEEGMHPDDIRAALKSRGDILKKHVRDKGQFLAHTSVNPKAVKLLAGDFDWGDQTPTAPGRTMRDYYIAIGDLEAVKEWDDTHDTEAMGEYLQKEESAAEFTKRVTGG